MFLKKLKKKIIQKKITEAVKNLKSSEITISDAKINTVLMLVDENNADDATLKFKNQFKEYNFNIKKITFVTCKDVKLLDENDVCEKQFNVVGTLKATKIKNIINTKADLLINFTRNNLFLDLIAATSKATFKVGYANEDAQLYNLTIKAVDNAVFCSELKKYLTILNKL